MVIHALMISTLLALQAAFVDLSPHTQRFVTADDGTRLEVLDWGGSGRVLLLLAQMGQTAHIYDDWAPTLTTRFRVLGMTRRGFGASSVPVAGYYADRLGQDVLAVLDGEHLDSPILVGNGFAGEELSWVGAHVPARRIAGLVYLDAAYDRTGVAEEAALVKRIPPAPGAAPDTSSIVAFARWASAGLGVPIPASEVAQLARIATDGRVMGERTPPAVREQILAGVVAADYLRIRVPALAIYARRTISQAFRGCTTDDAAGREACRDLETWTEQQRIRSVRALKTIRAPVRVVELPDASPFVFLSNASQVAREIEQFSSALSDPQR
jgi:pimeloyl-ACP methyl ester carboxylesterase